MKELPLPLFPATEIAALPSDTVIWENTGLAVTQVGDIQATLAPGKRRPTYITDLYRPAEISDLDFSTRGLSIENVYGIRGSVRQWRATLAKRGRRSGTAEELRAYVERFYKVTRYGPLFSIGQTFSLKTGQIFVPGLLTEPAIRPVVRELYQPRDIFAVEVPRDGLGAYSQAGLLTLPGGTPENQSELDALLGRCNEASLKITEENFPNSGPGSSGYPTLREVDAGASANQVAARLPQNFSPASVARTLAFVLERGEIYLQECFYDGCSMGRREAEFLCLQASENEVVSILVQQKAMEEITFRAWVVQKDRWATHPTCKRYVVGFAK